MGFPDGSVGKESACNAADSGDAAWIPWSVRSPGGGHGNPFQYSCLENPVDREGWQATVHRVTKSHIQLSMHPITSYIPSPLHPSSPCNLSFDFTEKFFVPTDLPSLFPSFSFCTECPIKWILVSPTPSTPSLPYPFVIPIL